MQKIGNINNEAAWQIALTTLRDKFIQQISNDTFEHRVLDYFDFVAWLNSKINNTSFYQSIIENNIT